MGDIERILVLSLSTKDCKKAVHYGISLARKYSAQFSILHVIYDPFMLRGGVLYVPLLKSLEQEYQAMVREVKKDLAAIIQKEKGEGLAIREIVKEAEPIQELIKTVEEEHIDLLIMAAHSETRIEHVLYGRVNHEIIRRLPCSVFLVRGE